MIDILRPDLLNSDRLTNWYEPESFPSLKLHPDCVSNLGRVSKVIFLGSSGVGKSHIQQAVMNASRDDPIIGGRISVPRRIVTREPRPDDGEEITYSSEDALEALAKSGELGLWGVKLMEGGREELFGLEKPDDGTLPILFANNTIVRNPQSIGPNSVLDEALIVGIYAPDDVRESRLRQRSPHLFVDSPDEIALRLSRDESSRIVLPVSHVIVKNFGRFQERVASDVVNFLKLVELSREQELLTELSAINTKNRYIVMRHGESEANRDGLIVSSLSRGLNKFGITQRGVEQVLHAVEQAVNLGLNIDAIYTSPFLRCKESAQTFAEAYGFNADILVSDKLRERDFGSFDGADKSNYRRVYQIDQNRADGSRVLFGAETPKEVLDRFTDLIKELEETHEGQTILLVTHADVGEIAQAGFKGLPPQTHRLFTPKIGNGCLRVMATA